MTTERPPIGYLSMPAVTVHGISAQCTYADPDVIAVIMQANVGVAGVEVDAGDAADLAVQIVDALSDDLADSVRQRIGAGTRAGAA